MYTLINYPSAMDPTRTVAGVLALRGDAGATFDELVGDSGLSRRTVWKELMDLRKRGAARREPQVGGRGRRGRWYHVPPPEASFVDSVRSSVERRLRAVVKRAEDERIELGAAILALQRLRQEYLLRLLDEILGIYDPSRKGMDLIVLERFQAETEVMARVWDDTTLLALLARPKVARRALHLVLEKFGADLPTDASRRTRGRPASRARRG